MTPAEVMERCGLDPYFSGEHPGLVIRTGRTTRMLVHAVCSISKGEPIRLVGRTVYEANRLKERLDDMVSKCDVVYDPLLVKVQSIRSSDKYKGRQRVPFVDHAALEGKPSKAADRRWGVLACREFGREYHGTWTTP